MGVLTMRTTALALAILVACAAAPAAWADVATGTQAGVAGAVRGSVLLAKADYTPPPRAVGQNLVSGNPIYLGDQIATGTQSGLQIMLLDKTTVTLGQDAKLTIDKMIYDPQTHGGSIEMNVVQGAFRFVSGEVAHSDPNAVTLLVPGASIGVRGTIIGGNITPNVTLIGLLGPGLNNTAGANPGAITVTNRFGTVTINRPNFVTEVRPGGAPSTPHLGNPAQLTLLGQSNGPPPSNPLGNTQTQNQTGPTQNASTQGALNLVINAENNSQTLAPLNPTGSPSNPTGNQPNTPPILPPVPKAPTGAVGSPVLADFVTSGLETFPYTYPLLTGSIASGSFNTGYTEGGDTYTASFAQMGGSMTNLYTDTYGVVLALNGGSEQAVDAGSGVSSYLETYNYNNAGKVAYLVGGAGTDPNTLPTSGSATFSPVYSKATFGDGSGSGTVTVPTMTLHFAGANQTLDYGMSVAMSDGTTYAWNQNGISVFSGSIYTSTTASHTGGTNTACQSSCTATMAGGFFGPAAARIGVTFQVGAPQSPSVSGTTYTYTGVATNLIGVTLLTKN